MPCFRRLSGVPGSSGVRPRPMVDQRDPRENPQDRPSDPRKAPRAFLGDSPETAGGTPIGTGMSHWTHGKNTYVDSVRLTRTQFTEIFEDLELARREAPDSNRREGDRKHVSAIAGVLLEVEHPGGAAARFIVRPRNISRTGMGFIHGGYLYKGSKVTITLVMLDREMIVLRGTVMRCRHVKARIHEIGMRFAEPLSVDPFAPPREDAGAGATSAPGATTDASAAAPPASGTTA